MVLNYTRRVQAIERYEVKSRAQLYVNPAQVCVRMPEEVREDSTFVLNGNTCMSFVLPSKPSIQSRTFYNAATYLMTVLATSVLSHCLADALSLAPSILVLGITLSYIYLILLSTLSKDIDTVASPSWVVAYIYQRRPVVFPKKWSYG